MPKTKPQAAPARRSLFKNGTILTLDKADRTAEALVVEGDVIIGVGALDEMRSLAGKDVECVDLEGSVLLPGLIDSHPHAMHMAAFSIGAVNILDATCFEDIVKAIEARAEVTPIGEWIICTPVGEPHYYIRRNYLSLAERRLPDRTVLDVAAPRHPVYIMADAPRTPNICAFNSLALKKLGISRQMPSRMNEVEIEKDDDTGEPTGILRGKVNNYYSDDPFWHTLSGRLPTIPDGLWKYAGIAGIQKANANGVTGLYESHIMSPLHIQAYQQLREEGFCTARVMATLELSTYALSTMDYNEQEFTELLQLGKAMTQTKDDFVRVNGVTSGRGGPLTPGYLRMHEPYVAPNGGLTRGKTFLPRHVEKLIAQYCIDNNVRLNMVLGGYRDVDDWLQTLQEVAHGIDLRSREWVMQHCTFTAPSHVKAFKEHGFHVTTSSSFVYGKADLVRDRVGEWSLKDYVAMRRFVDAGLTMGCGSDWGPDNLWVQVALNETRESAHTGHQHLEYDQSISRLQSLHAFTRDAAKVMQWENIGQLRAGYKADMAIIDKNPLCVPVEELPDIQVLRTVVDGVGVYDSGGIEGGQVSIRPTAQDVYQYGISANEAT